MPPGTFIGPHVPTIYDVAAWPALHQVWITWKITTPTGPSATLSDGMEHIGYAIYRGEPCPNCLSGNYTWYLEGRVFDEDARGQRLKDLETITANNETLTIPDATGASKVLTQNERVFASTPHNDLVDVVYSVQPVFLYRNGTQACDTYSAFPVNPVGSEISEPVSYNIPVQPTPPAPRVGVAPVVQKTGVLTVQFPDDNGSFITGNFPYTIYCLWIDGSNTPDLPRNDIDIMANAGRNGTPHLFVKYEPDPNLPIPIRAKISPYADLGGANAIIDNPPTGLVHVLHGGGQDVFKFSPGGMPPLDLIPYTSHLVAHDDALYAIGGSCEVVSKSTAWFGYAKFYDAFKHPSNNVQPQGNNTVYNFTQRRVMFINQWLLETNDNVFDPENVSLIGFSMGSHGASHISRTFPNEFASVVLNAHSAVPINPSIYQDVALGASDPDNTICNLNNGTGSPVTMRDVWVYNNKLSGARDYPMIKQILGKTDNNDLQQWQTETITQIDIATEDQGWGLQFFFDQRDHGGTDPNTFWATSPYGFINRSAQLAANWQTRYRKSKSYPAFYKVRPGDTSAVSTSDTRIPDLGDGSNPDVNPCDVQTGDDAGTIGGHIGWFRLEEEQFRWSVDAFLIGPNMPPPAFSPYSPKDHSPAKFAAAHMTVRKNGVFDPPIGKQILVTITKLGNPNVTQPTFIVEPSDPDKLIRIDQDIKLFDDALVRIELTY